MSIHKARFKMIVEVALFLRRRDDVLLLRRFNTGYADGLYHVPAGHVDGGEEVRAAMVREAREEIGIGLRPDDLDVAGVMHRRGGDERISFFFAADRWDGEPTNLEPHKCDDLTWFPVGGPPPGMVPYVRTALDRYVRGELYTPYGWNSLRDE